VLRLRETSLKDIHIIISRMPTHNTQQQNTQPNPESKLVDFLFRSFGSLRISEQEVACALSCLISALVWSCLVWSGLVLSCLVLSCLVLSCLVLSCLVWSCLVWSCLVLSCLVLSCLVLFCLVGLVWSCLVWSCLVLSCLVLSCLVLSCLVWSGLILSCLVLSSPARRRGISKNRYICTYFRVIITPFEEPSMRINHIVKTMGRWT
jgi:hypothetical protein